MLRTNGARLSNKKLKRVDLESRLSGGLIITLHLKFPQAVHVYNDFMTDNCFELSCFA